MKSFSVLLFIASVLTTAGAAAEGDPENGREVFFARCMTCHAMACNREGPKLDGVIGREAGTVSDFDGYSKPLQESGIVWDEESLGRFLAAPEKVLPGTNMVMGGEAIEDPEQRNDLIAFISSGDTSLDICP